VIGSNHVPLDPEVKTGGPPGCRDDICRFSALYYDLSVGLSTKTGSRDIVIPAPRISFYLSTS